MLPRFHSLEKHLILFHITCFQSALKYSSNHFKPGSYSSIFLFTDDLLGRLMLELIKVMSENSTRHVIL